MSRRPRGQLRVIGGTWRRRRLPVPPQGVRPTADRVRETLFNWLGPNVEGAHCLDLFAGTGALGIEALSRGAAHVTFVEADPQAARQLRSNLDTLGARAGRVEQRDALDYLRHVTVAPIDLIFLDPPYGAGWPLPCCEAVRERGWLHPGGRLYIEDQAGATEAERLPGWEVERQGRAGRSRFYLLKPADHAERGN